MKGLPSPMCIAIATRRRHFLIWLQCSGLAIESVDGTVIDDFLRHDCRCAAWSAPVRLRRWRKCRTSPYLMRFIHFLERTGRIETPGDLDENFRVLEAFLERLRGDSYATQTVKLYRYGCAGLLVWLHLSRIPPERSDGGGVRTLQEQAVRLFNPRSVLRPQGAFSRDGLCNRSPRVPEASRRNRPH